MMPLLRALRSLKFQGLITGTSDQALIDKVDDLVAGNPKLRLPGPKALTAKACLDGTRSFEALAALHRLAESAALRYPVGLYGWHRNWAVQRYLGFFDPSPGAPEHKLSALGLQVGGNHRRMVSEDLGIAFGLSVAELWCQDAVAGASVDPIDLDRVLFGGHQVKGATVSVNKSVKRRADYLLQLQDPTKPNTLQFRILECKGTASPGNRVSQLASAVGQLDGVKVNGIVPPALAVSTCTGSADWTYSAIDPEEKLVEVEVNPRVVGLVREGIAPDEGFRDQTVVLFEDPELFAARSLSSCMAKLAVFSGRARGEVQSPDSPRVASTKAPLYDAPVGEIRAVSDLFSANGQEFRIYQGVERSIDKSLSTREPLAFLEAQAAVAAKVAEDRASAKGQDGSLEGVSVREIQEHGIWSLASNGSVLGIVPS